LSATAWRAQASHIVGGELTYTCEGNNTYLLTLTLYRDCLDGQRDALAQDVPAWLGVFSLDPTSNFSIIDTNTLYPFVDQIIDHGFSNECIDNIPTVCLNKLVFNKRVTLPPNGAGYRVVYSRCCRNASVINIRNPQETGATYTCTIPPPVGQSCNNSALFVDTKPPQIICINNPFVYNHRAVDPDGDSLSYEFCIAYSGGNPDDAKPYPTRTPPQTIQYQSPYTASRPMLGNPLIRINAVTGMITGTPTSLGRFIVTVCCHEWRNGQIINTVQREFQYVVTDCSKKIIARIPEYSTEENTYIVECKSNTVKFVNQSEGGRNYLWDFGVPGATSTEFEPTYTYPDTGVYIVKLRVDAGPTCVDSISKVVKIYPQFFTDYEYSGDLCPNAELKFVDKSTATYPPIVAWDWNFKDGNTSTEQNPSHVYAVGGRYAVRLISTSQLGCRDSAVKEVFVDDFVPFAGNDTVIVKGEYVNFNASGGVSYEWTPADLLTNPMIPNPRGFYPDTGRYNYVVSMVSVQGCVGRDTMQVWVVNQSALFVPSAFSPNGDGLNDFLKPLGVGYSDVRFFRVFNRFGELVFNGEDFTRGWDGTYKGKPADVGVYFWLLGVTDRFGKDAQMKGDVTLMR
jgi:FOG: PKD repeat